jgi:hypothetical protein
VPDLLTRNDQLNSVGAVLLLRAKTILVSGHLIKLFSFDGKTWFSRAKSFTDFKRRRAREKEICQKEFQNLSERSE